MTCIRCQLLEQQINELKIKLSGLIPDTSQMTILKKKLGLSHAEASLILLLYNNPQTLMSKYTIDKLMPNRAGVSTYPPDAMTRIGVVLCNVRRKLRAYGIQNPIQTVARKGIYISRTGYDFIHETLKAD